MPIQFSLKQKEYLRNNGMSISENKGEYTLHYDTHSCSGLSEKEVKYIIDQYISGAYCSYRPVNSKSILHTLTDD